MSKPVIAITPECKFDPDTDRSRGSITLNLNYAEEIEKAGGVPLIVPPMPELPWWVRVVRWLQDALGPLPRLLAPADLPAPGGSATRLP